MNAENNTFKAFVLRVTQTSESFLKIDFITPNHGLINALFRYSPSPRRNNNLKPDLFDTCEININIRDKTKGRFLKEYNPMIKRTNIGKSYNGLDHACLFAKFLLINLGNVPDPSDLYILVEKSFNSFNSEAPPEIVLIKAVYNFLKTEGFPVNSSWWQSIPASKKKASQIILRSPVNKKFDASEIEDAIFLSRHLGNWIRDSTELKSIYLNK